MGTVCWHAGIPVVARSIQVEFHLPVPLTQNNILTAEVVATDGRDVSVRAWMTTENGDPLAESIGKFHVLKYEQFKKLAPGKHGDLKRWFPES